MRLLRLDEAPISGSDRVFRYSTGRALAIALIAIASSGALAWAGWRSGSLFAYYLAAVVLLSLVILQTLVLARFKPSNWLVRSTGSGLYIQFRSYLNYRFPREHLTVVFVPYDEIRSAWLVRERRELPDKTVPPSQAETRVLQYRRSIELEVASDTRLLGEALQAEAARSGAEGRQRGITSTRYRHSPVRLLSPTTVQLEWQVTPGARTFLDVLRPYVGVAAEVDRSRSYTDLESLGREEQHERLRELAQTGQTLTAVYLARKLYGLDLTNAKAFIDGLHSEYLPP